MWMIHLEMRLLAFVMSITSTVSRLAFPRDFKSECCSLSFLMTESAIKFMISSVKFPKTTGYNSCRYFCSRKNTNATTITSMWISCFAKLVTDLKRSAYLNWDAVIWDAHKAWIHFVWSKSFARSWPPLVSIMLANVANNLQILLSRKSLKFSDIIIDSSRRAQIEWFAVAFKQLRNCNCHKWPVHLHKFRFNSNAFHKLRVWPFVQVCIVSAV